MKLEEGRRYRLRNGAITEPLTLRRDDYGLNSEFVWKAHVGPRTLIWTIEGVNYTPGALDIVAGADDPFPAVTKASLLDAAKAAVADRGLNYGKPEDNFLRIARLWGMHLMNRYAPGGLASECRIPNLDAEDVAMMMVLMKVARLENDPKHLDSWTDLAGYAACGAEITNG